MLHDDIKQRSKIVGRILQLVFRNASARIGIDDRKLQLILARIEVDKQIVEFVENFLNAGVGPVNLVDDGDNGQLGLQRLHQNVPRLRKRPLAGVHEEQHTVNDLHCAFYFAAKIAMAWSIDDVDFYAAVADARVLGKDGDTALALELIGVHDPLGDVFIGTKDSALAQHRVHQRRLSVIHMRDDCDVANSGVTHQRRDCNGIPLSVPSVSLW